MPTTPAAPPPPSFRQPTPHRLHRFDTSPLLLVLSPLRLHHHIASAHHHVLLFLLTSPRPLHHPHQSFPQFTCRRHQRLSFLHVLSSNNSAISICPARYDMLALIRSCLFHTEPRFSCSLLALLLVLVASSHYACSVLVSCRLRSVWQCYDRYARSPCT